MIRALMLAGMAAVWLFAGFCSSSILHAADPEAAPPAEKPDLELGDDSENSGEGKSVPAAGDGAVAIDENAPVDFGDTLAPGTAAAPGQAQPKSFGRSLFQIFATLAALMALLVGGLWLMKKYMPGIREFSGNSVIRVLSKARLSPTQSVYLVRIGDKGLVLGITGGAIQTLSEINDSRQLDMLTAQSAARGRDSTSQAFTGILRSRELQYGDAGDNGPQDGGEVERMQDELREIRSRIAKWNEGAVQ